MTTTDKKIHLEQFIPATPERVYELLINGAKFGDVTRKPGKGGGMEGAYFELFGGWLNGRQIELVANERIVQAWRFKEWEPGVFSLVKFNFVPEEDGTRLIVEQSCHPEQFHEHLSTNWKPFYFDPLLEHFGSNIN